MRTFHPLSPVLFPRFTASAARRLRLLTSVLCLLTSVLLVPSAHAFEWQNSGIWDSDSVDRAFDSGPAWFTAGPSWMMNALPGSHFRTRVLDRSADIQESTAEAPYVGTLHDLFDVNLFSNVSGFAVASGPKISGGVLSLLTSSWAGGSASWNSNANPGWNGGGVPNNIGDTANFAATTAGTTTQDIAAGVTVGTISFSGGNANITRTISLTNNIILNQDGAGAGTATITNTNTNTGTGNALVFSGAGALTLNDDVVISNTGGSTNATGAIQLSSVIGGSGNVTFSNASTALSQTASIRLGAANTFTGSVLIQKGTVTFGGSGTPFGSSANAVTLGQSGQGSAAFLSTSAVGLSNPIMVASGSGGTLTLGAFTSSSSTSTWAGTITLNDNVQLYSDQTGSTGLSLTGAISGTGGIIKVGSGLLTLGVVNSYTGDTTISSGVLQINSTSTLGSTSTPGTLKLSGGTLNTSNSTAASIPNAAVVTADSAITTTSTAATPVVNFTGTLSGTAGTLTLRNDAASGGGVFDVRFSGGDFTMGRPIVIANGVSGTTRLNDFNTTGTTHTYNGVISGTGSFRRSASTAATGGDTIFSAANTFSGGVLLNDGAIGLGIDSVGPAGAVTSGPLGTGTLTVGGAAANAEAIYASGGARTVNNAILLNTTNSLLTVKGTNDLTLGGVISGSGPLTKTDSGTLTLTNANTYTGTTTISNGTLQLGNGGTTGSLSTSSAIVDNANFSINRSNPVTQGTDFSGAAITGTGALSKSGGGTLTLNAANTYQGGTSVTAGTLLVINTTGSGTGTTSVTVTNSGTTLSGGTTNGTGGITGAVNINPSANLSPGTSGNGAGTTAILHTGALTLVSGSNFNVDISNTTPGTGYDQIIANGISALSGANLAVTTSGTLTTGQKFFILENSSANPNPVGQTFSNGATVTDNVGNIFTINYADTGDATAGNDISLTVLTPIPEPSTWIGAALALGAIGVTQRKRFAKRLRIVS
jgi:fibronectin-binding autotransporter adhesin